MWSVNYINRRETLGLYKLVPGFKLGYIRDAMNTYESVRTPKEELDIIQQYLDHGKRSNRIPIDDYIYLNYTYLTKTTFTDDIINELKIITELMRSERCKQYRGFSKIDASCTWCETIPHIVNHRIIYQTCTSIVNNNNTSIVYVNTTIPKELLEFFKTAFEVDFERLDDNTYLLKSDECKVSILLLSKDYDQETITNHIIKTLGIEEESFKKEFYLTQPSFVNISKNHELSNLIKQYETDALLNSILKYDRDIHVYFNHYIDSINNRRKQVEQLQKNATIISKVDSLTTTLDKMKDFVSWGLHRTAFSDKTLTLSIKTPIFNYDEGVAKRLLERNPELTGYVGKANKWIIKMYEDCFVKNTRQLMTQTSVHVRLDLSTFVRNERYSSIINNHYTSEQFNILLSDRSKTQFIPNPHIYRFNCWGQNLEPLTDLLQQGKWEEMLYCLKATVGNLNFNDSTVMKFLFDAMCGLPDTYEVCKDIETGKMITIGDYKKEWEEYEKNQNN